jgi:hypothetical protein
MSMTERVTATEAEAEQVTKKKLMEDLRAVVAGALHQESCCAAGGGSGLRGAASSLALGEMAAAGLGDVAYGRCGEAIPAWLVSSILYPPSLPCSTIWSAS